MKINETMESKPLDKNKYLLVSNGCEIYCLDLKQNKCQSLSVIGDVPLLPIIAYLNLLEENLPTTVGLFKWRSNAYRIGGHKLLKALLKEEEEDRGIKLYRALCRSNKVEPTSSLIYSLSLDDGSKSTSLICHSESNMGKLKKPKIWPIVEEINGEIHVIDFLPFELVYSRALGWISSHEVLDCESGCWVEEVPIPTIEENIRINSYLVVGYKIYAVSSGGNFLVFNSKKNKWHVNSRTQREGDASLPLLRDVWDILEKIQVVRCIGGFPYGNIRDQLYVV